MYQRDPDKLFGFYTMEELLEELEDRDIMFEHPDYNENPWFLSVEYDYPNEGDKKYCISAQHVPRDEYFRRIRCYDSYPELFVKHIMENGMPIIEFMMDSYER